MAPEASFARSGALVIMRFARGVLEKLRDAARTAPRPEKCLSPAENMLAVVTTDELQALEEQKGGWSGVVVVRSRSEAIEMDKKNRRCHSRRL